MSSGVFFLSSTHQIVSLGLKFDITFRKTYFISLVQKWRVLIFLFSFLSSFFLLDIISRIFLPSCSTVPEVENRCHWRFYQRKAYRKVTPLKPTFFRNPLLPAKLTFTRIVVAIGGPPPTPNWGSGMRNTQPSAEGYAKISARAMKVCLFQNLFACGAIRLFY